MTGNTLQPVIRIRGLTTRFGSRTVHDNLDLDIYPGEVLAIVGGSGSGKSTLLREMTLLHTPSAGSVQLFGEEVTGLPDNRTLAIRRRIGVLFQQGALFGGQTVLENVGAPLREHTRLAAEQIDAIARIKLSLAGLAPADAQLYPSQLSGGMRKRAALARALALDPEILFLDEPTSGLDPLTADAFDTLILDLKAALSPTIVLVTHDMDSLWRIADRVVLVGDARILGQGTMQQLAQSTDPAVSPFFSGPRAHAARAANGQETA